MTANTVPEQARGGTVQQLLCSREMDNTKTAALRAVHKTVRDGLVGRLPFCLRERELPVQHHQFDKVRLDNKFITLHESQLDATKIFASAWLDAETVLFGTKDNKVPLYQNSKSTGHLSRPPTALRLRSSVVSHPPHLATSSVSACTTS